MATLIFERDELLGAWAAKKIPHVGSAEWFGPFRAIGVATGPTPTDRLMAVIVFHAYFPQFKHCQISVAASDPRWASRKTIRDVLAFPFLQYGCNLVWTVTPHTSDRVIRFNKAIGFVAEGTLLDRFGANVHATICRMRRRDYDRLYAPKTEPKEVAHG